MEARGQVVGHSMSAKSFGKGGFRHHVGVTFGSYGSALRESFETYLGYTIADF